MQQFIPLLAIVLLLCDLFSFFYGSLFFILCDDVRCAMCDVRYKNHDHIEHGPTDRQTVMKMRNMRKNL